MSGLAGKTAIVTGSSSGIGKGIVQRFANEGANVVVNSRSQERADATAEAIDADDGEVLPVAADASDRSAMDTLVSRCVDTFGSVDVMVNNAGLFSATPALEISTEEWNTVLATNLSGVLYGSQAAGEQMIQQGTGGQIINISSIYGSVGVPGRAAYNASKAGVDNLTRNLAVEWAHHDIQVNALAPGYIETDSDGDDESAEADDEPVDEGEDDGAWPRYDFSTPELRNRIPMGRFGTVEEISNCARFLAEGDHYITGEVIASDGGWLAFGHGSKGP